MISNSNMKEMKKRNILLTLAAAALLPLPAAAQQRMVQMLGRPLNHIECSNYANVKVQGGDRNELQETNPGLRKSEDMRWSNGTLYVSGKENVVVTVDSLSSGLARLLSTGRSRITVDEGVRFAPSVLLQADGYSSITVGSVHVDVLQARASGYGSVNCTKEVQVGDLSVETRGYSRVRFDTASGQRLSVSAQHYSTVIFNGGTWDVYNCNALQYASIKHKFDLTSNQSVGVSTLQRKNGVMRAELAQVGDGTSSNDEEQGEALETLSDVPWVTDSLTEKDFMVEEMVDNILMQTQEALDYLSDFPDGAGEFVAQIRELGNSIKELQQTQSSGKTVQTASGKKRQHYSFSQRSHASFLWAFHNWGDEWYGGLRGTDGAYSARTSFSSYQLQWQFDFLRSRHWSMSAGIGYESDVYKFHTPYVGFDGAQSLVEYSGSAIQSLEGARPEFANDGLWSSRLTARYITFPIRLGYRSDGILRHWKVGLTLLPGLNYSGSHTGLKHEFEQRGSNYVRKDPSFDTRIDPFKLDVGLSMGWRAWMFFVQMPTRPVLQDMDRKLYPVKFGFSIGLS